MSKEPIVDRLAAKLWDADFFRATEKHRYIDWSEAGDETKRRWRLCATTAIDHLIDEGWRPQ